MSRRMSCVVAVILGLAGGGLATFVGKPQVLKAAGQTARPDFALARGLESLTIAVPPDNALTTGRIALGKALLRHAPVQDEEDVVRDATCRKKAGPTAWRCRPDSTAA